MKQNSIQKIRGTNDILPADYGYWLKIKNTFEAVMQNGGFKYIEPPILEYKELFIRSVGENTDIVNKEIFGASRLDSTDEIKYALRPEFTAGIARSFIENGMSSWALPVQLYYWGPSFRYDRPQAGRYRQFYQGGFEIFGDDTAESDALSILVVYEMLEKLNLAEKVIFEINTLGDESDRSKIQKAYKEYFSEYKDKLCPDCQQRLDKNILRLLDCKEKNCQKIQERAPQLIDLLSQKSRDRFKFTLETLDELNICYSINPKLVRGLDYYTNFVFEIRDIEDDTRQSSLGGGGRYNNLVKELGGNPTSGIGFAFGVERYIEKMKQYKIKPDPIPAVKVYIIQIGNKAKKKSLNIIYKLHQFGIPAAPVMGGRDSLKSQLKYVDKMNAPIAVIIGQKEAIDGTAIIRNMKDGVQEIVDFEELILKLKDILNL